MKTIIILSVYILFQIVIAFFAGYFWGKHKTLERQIQMKLEKW